MKKISNSLSFFIIISVIIVANFLVIFDSNRQEIEALNDQISSLKRDNTRLVEEKDGLITQNAELSSRLLLSTQYHPDELIEQLNNSLASMEKYTSGSAILEVAYKVLNYKAKAIQELYPDTVYDKQAEQIVEKATRLIEQKNKIVTKNQSASTNTSILSSNLKQDALQSVKVNSTTNNSQQNEKAVYITNTGSKYHRSSCPYLRQSKIAIDKTKAIKQGYTPCSRCNP